MKLILLILISIVTCSCDKNDDLIAPPITKENTFSCRIDGELFVAQPHGGFLYSDNGISAISTEDIWLIKLGNGKKDLYINLNTKDSDMLKKIMRSDGNTDFINEVKNVIELTVDSGQFASHISHDNTGFINILELENDSIMIFEFDQLVLYDEDDPTQTITLTEGKMNINLATLNKD